MKETVKKNFCRRLCVFLSLVFMFSALLSVVSTTAYGAEKAGLSKASLTLEVGKTKTLKVTGTKSKVTWSSSDKSVATVTSNGKVKAKKAGKATIIAKAGKKKYECQVTVKKASGNPDIKQRY